MVRSFAVYMAVIPAPGLAVALAVFITFPTLAQSPPACPDPVPTAVDVEAIPIVVMSTINDYFVLYAKFDVDGTEVEFPVAVVRGEAGTTTIEENIKALPKERYRVEKYLVADPADVDGDCIDDITELNNLGDMNPVNPGAFADPKNGVVAVPDMAAFRAQGSLGHPGVYLKFVLLDWDTELPAIYFMNTKLHPSHQSFFRAVDLEEEGSITGTITFDPAFVVPGRGVPGFHYFYLPRVLDEGFLTHVEQVHAVLAASMGFIEDNLTLHVGSYLLHIQERIGLLRASRIPLAFDSDIYSEVEFLALNPGVGYGRLRVLEAEERPHPRDIIVSATLPNELPRVAGILTAAPQTPLSHVNLRAVQAGIPNAYVKDVLDHADITSLQGSYVRYEVAERWWELRAATLQEVEDHYESSRPVETQMPERDLSITEITPLDQIGFDDWRSFGVKAANLAVLHTLGFPQGTVRDGFAIPFYFYDEFMQRPLAEETVFGRGSAPDEEKLTLAAETTLIEAVEAILAHPKFQSDLDIQEEMLDDLWDAIKDAQTPQWMIDALTAMHATFPADTSLRYRSSTNNEDLPGFNGAGLYDSYTQHPEETSEEGTDKSFKQVLAGLWTFRAFSEREFNRVDHLAAAMGVLVHPNFSDELVNGVAVSFDPASLRGDRYYVNSQVGEDLVTNPEADSVPEEIVLLPGGGLSIRAFSNRVEPGDLLMSREQMSQLREHLDVIHDHFDRLYNPAADEPFAMEIEFKITSENVLAIKQARPWVFGGASLPTPPTPQTTPTPTPQPTPQPGSGSSGGGGGGGGGSSNRPPSVDGPKSLQYSEHDTEPVGIYTADDPEGTEISWQMEDTDAEHFRISDDGVLTFIKPPDYENPVDFRLNNTYQVRVLAFDSGIPRASGHINVRIEIKQVNELGPVTGEAELAVEENFTGALGQYEVEDPEGDAMAWSLSGPDSAFFGIDEEGFLSLNDPLDFEALASAAGTNEFAVTIVATDDNRRPVSRELPVAITVTNVNEGPISIQEIPLQELTAGDAPVSLNLNQFFTDMDGDPLTYTLAEVEESDAASVGLEDGLLSITPLVEGTATFGITASDPATLSETFTVNVSVASAPPLPPTLEPTPAPTPEQTPEPTPTPTPDPEPTPSPASSPTSTPTPLAVRTQTPTPTQAPTPTAIPTPIPTSSATPSPTPPATSMPSPTPSPTSAPTPSSTPTPMAITSPEPTSTETLTISTPEDMPVNHPEPPSEAEGGGISVWATLLIFIGLLITTTGATIFVYRRLRQP